MPHDNRRLILLLVLLATLLPATAARAAGTTIDSIAPPTASQPLAIALVTAARALAPGDTVTVALRLRPLPGWHTYWRYAGDVGAAPVVAWHLPAGYTVSPLRWPAPDLLSTPPLASYGYARPVLLLATLHVPRSARVGSSARLGATVSWVACRVSCVAGDASVALARPVSLHAARDARTAGILADADARVPGPGEGWRFAARADSATLLLRVRPPRGARIPAGATVRFFADSASVIDHAAPQLVRRSGADPAALDVVLERSEYATAVPARLTGVLEVSAPGAPAAAVPLALDVRAPVVADLDAALGLLPDDGGWTRLLAAVLLALLGGTLLNLMPCVLPVLSIKALSLAEAAGADRATARRHALLFGAGVLVSMWALVGALLVLRAAGAEVGWGYQLQDPAVVGALALLVFAAALGMLGVFELAPMGGGLAVAASRRSRTVEAFLSGVLATALATPCSAPFLATAVAYGITAGAGRALAVFTALGLGLVWPVAVFALAPGARRWLPRPGAWMVTLRQLLAFPLFATVAWLAWVLGRQAGTDAVAALLAALVVMAAGSWTLGRFGGIAAGVQARRLARAAAGIGVAASVAIVARATPLGADGRTATTRAPAAVEARDVSALPWLPYDADSIAAWRARGRVVLVDFTADWCLTCKLNERVALESSAVRAALTAHHVALVRADWTSRDPVITRALASFGRSSVPLAVLYPATRNAAPVILPTLLTPAIVTRAIDRASAPSAAS